MAAQNTRSALSRSCAVCGPDSVSEGASELMKLTGTKRAAGARYVDHVLEELLSWHSEMASAPSARSEERTPGRSEERIPGPACGRTRAQS